jgi:hypothetical protein
MDEVDGIFVCFDAQRSATSTIISFLYTGVDLPPHCAPMPRLPEPVTGMIFDDGFPSVLGRTLELNAAIHDGAIMIGRSVSMLPYYIVGWSYRLFPPQGACEAEPNRGSAFNSCLAMSSVETVDRVYLISKGGVFRFEKSIAEEVWH